MNIGMAVRVFRAKKDLKRYELAEMAGITTHTLESIEYGMANTSVPTFCALAKGMGMKPWELLKEAENYD